MPHFKEEENAAPVAAERANTSRAAWAAECAEGVAKKRRAVMVANAALEQALQLHWRADAAVAEETRRRLLKIPPPTDAEQQMIRSIQQILTRRAMLHIERETGRSRGSAPVYFGVEIMDAIAAYVKRHSAELAEDYEGRELQLMEWADRAAHCDDAVRGAFEYIVDIEVAAERFMRRAKAK